MMASPPEALPLDPGILDGGANRLCHCKVHPACPSDRGCVGSASAVYCGPRCMSLRRLTEGIEHRHGGGGWGLCVCSSWRAVEASSSCSNESGTCGRNRFRSSVAATAASGQLPTASSLPQLHPTTAAAVSTKDAGCMDPSSPKCVSNSSMVASIQHKSALRCSAY
jgi:hypothetical protein